MSRFFGILIDTTHERGLRLLIWAIVFLGMLCIATWVVAEQVSTNMRAETQRSLAGYERLRANVLATFDEMDRRLTQPACSAALIDDVLGSQISAVNRGTTLVTITAEHPATPEEALELI